MFKNLKRARVAQGICCFALLLAGPLFAASGERQWIGEFRLGGESTPLTVHDRSALKEAASTVDLPSMGAREVPLTTISASANALAFQLDGPPGRFVFDGKVKQGKVHGAVVQGEARGEFDLVEILPADAAAAAAYTGSYEVAPGHVIGVGPMGEMGGLLVFLDHKSLREGPLYALSATRFASGPTIGVAYPFAIEVEFLRDRKQAVTGLRWTEAGKTFTARKIAAHRVEQVTVRNGDVTLKGTLMLPATPGPHPAIVFAHGSGDATRDVAIWNPYFVRLGMAVLSLDKRGAGASSGDWRAASLDDIADDWLAGVAMLKQRKDIDAKRIGVHGSSQGGWTAPLMAAKSKDIAFVIVRAGSGVSVRDTMVHEIGWSAREAGMSDSDALAAEAAAAQMFEYAATSADWDTISSYVAKQKDQPWSQHVWPFQWSKDGWGIPWAKRNVGYDGSALASKSRVPLLWFLGEQDHNVPTAASATALQAALKQSGHPDFRIVRLTDTGHSFLASVNGNNSDIAKQSHMVAGYWDAMETWLRERGFVK